MAWINLIIAGLFETAWAIGMKYSKGFTQLKPSIFTIVSMLLSLLFLSRAVKTLPIGTGYAVWTGLGAVGTVILGIILFNEPHDIKRLLCLFMIIAGIVGLKITYTQ